MAKKGASGGLDSVPSLKFHSSAGEAIKPTFNVLTRGESTVCPHFEGTIKVREGVVERLAQIEPPPF